MYHLRFRQVHLDFHTSPDISGIGEKFNRKAWQEQLKRAHIDSITCFSLCHHGWSYHPTEVGKMHPHLKFNLLQEQFDAAREIGVNVPVYLSAGLNYQVSLEHPEWNEYSPAGKGPNPLQPGFIKLCFNTPYLDLLCRSIEEAAGMFPEASGIFLDIINQGQCCCAHCRQGMLNEGLDPSQEADRLRFARKVLENYYVRTTAAAKRFDPAMPIFHNSGHIAVGDTEILKYFSHLELESLPTGGWGYDHYPMSAAYSRNLGKDFLGMTGKFHTTWGEFGGIKHPNALRYECAAMLANGSKCSIGDQLHPSGELDESTYELIGRAYAEVEEKEAWCDHVKSLAKIAILASPTANHRDESSGDIGAARLLLEAHIPFDMVDKEMPFESYQVLLLPDRVMLDAALKAKLEGFLAQGGRLILSAGSGLTADGDSFALPLPFTDAGWSPYSPDFIEAADAFAPGFAKTPFVMYLPGRRIKVREAESLGKVYDPYFNRDFRHFCSHQHTPYRPEPSGFDAGAVNGQILYFAHPVFSIYRGFGMVYLQEFVLNAIRRFLGTELPVESSLPTTARVTLMEQPAQHRAVLHLLFANTVNRGGAGVSIPGHPYSESRAVEVVEELLPLREITLGVKLDRPVARVRLVPQKTELPFEVEEGRIRFTVPELICHQMVEFSYR